MRFTACGKQKVIGHVTSAGRSKAFFFCDGRLTGHQIERKRVQQVKQQKTKVLMQLRK